MSYIDNLSEADSTLYAELSEQGLAARKSGTQDYNAWARGIFKNSELSFEILTGLAMIHFRAAPFTQWSYANLSGKSLYFLTQTRPLTLSLCKFSAKNSNFDWKTVEHILTVNPYVKADAKMMFIEKLHPDIVTEDFLFKLASAYPLIDGVHFSVIADHARRVFGYDEALPDSWIERILVQDVDAPKVSA